MLDSGGEIVSLELLLCIGAFALLDMFSPPIIGVTVYVLLSVKKKQSLLIITYLTTVILFYFCIGVFLMLGLDIVFSPIVDVLNNNIAIVLITIIGGTLIMGSWFVYKKKVADLPKPKEFKVKGMIGLGITTSLFEVATAIPYFASIGLMVSNKFSISEWLPVLIGYNLIIAVPVLVLLLLNLLFKRFMHIRLKRLQALFQKKKFNTFWTMFFVGLILLTNGGNFGSDD